MSTNLPILYNARPFEKEIHWWFKSWILSPGINLVRCRNNERKRVFFKRNVLGMCEFFKAANHIFYLASSCPQISFYLCWLHSGFSTPFACFKDCPVVVLSI